MSKNRTQDQSPVALAAELSRLPFTQVVEFGRFEMDTWYYSPYPEPYASQHKLYICEYTLKYFRKKKTLMRHLAKLDLRHPPGGREVGEGLCNLDGMGGEEDISLGGRGGGGREEVIPHPHHLCILNQTGDPRCQCCILSLLFQAWNASTFFQATRFTGHRPRRSASQTTWAELSQRLPLAFSRWTARKQR